MVMCSVFACDTEKHPFVAQHRKIVSTCGLQRYESILHTLSRKKLGKLNAKTDQ